MINAIVGQPTLLQLQLFDGATDRWPRAYVRDQVGALLYTVNLVHAGFGLYRSSFTPSSEQYYSATYIVYTDNTYSVEDTDYERAEDSYYADVPLTAGDVASEVWDIQMLPHNIPGSFGDHFQAIRQFVEGTNYQVTAGPNSLAALNANISQQGLLTRAEVNQNEVKIDAIIPAVNLARDSVNTNVLNNTTLIQNLSAQISNVDAHLAAEINQNEVKIDQAISLIGTIQNNTTTRFIVPEQMMKPETGYKTYQFHLRLYDTMGNAEAPDTTPTIRIRNLESGVDIVNNVLMVQDGAKVGAYYFEYAISSGALLEHFLVEATVVEGGATRYVPAVTEITEYQADLQAIQNTLNDVEYIVTVNQNLLNNPTYGLAALHNDNLSEAALLTTVNNTVNNIQSLVAAIPLDVATHTDALNILSAISLLPTLTQIQNALEYVRSQIMGPDNKNNTEIYDKIDFSNVLLETDPRLNFLDAAISSRSTLTAANVWSYATRTLTNLTIPIAEFEKVWNVLTSQITIPNSIGQYILNMLNVPVDTRATELQVQTLLVGVAQESSVQQALTLINQDLAAGAICCSNLTNLLTAVKAKTDNIPPDPATEQNVLNSATDIENMISNLQLIVNAIKVYTDRIPVDPAHEGTVSGIPHNPVLATDPRLAYLDAFVSSRATPISLAGIATTTDVNNAKLAIITEVNQNEVKIDALQLSVNQRPVQSYFDGKFSPLATTAQLNQTEADIINAMPTLSVPTPADIWSYGTRTLTTPFPDISNLATKTDIVHTYTTKFSTTFRTLTNDQELIVWMEKDGNRVTSASNCVVDIKNSSGTSLWSATLSSPSADGVFRFISGVSLGTDSNYYIVISINADSAVRTSQQAFFTIG